MNCINVKNFWAVVCLCFGVLLSVVGSEVSAAESVVKDGEKIAFMGDSITQQGAGGNGYVRLVVRGFKAIGVEVGSIPVGVSGHKSNQMLARLERDVLSKKPEWMTLSCGVNDVWHGARGVALEDYKKNITQIVDRCRAANVKVMLLTSTMIYEDAASKENQKLKGYNDFLVSLAKEKKCLLADLNSQMQELISNSKDKKGGKLLTKDGVHMNADGNRMMAEGVLRAFGFGVSDMEKVHKAWGVAK